MATIHFTTPAELKELAGREADRLGVSIGELITPILAKALRRPDLAKAPRRRAGRPRKIREPQPA